MTDRIKVLIVLSFLLCLFPGGASAAGLHTDVALTPREGGTIVRMQYRRIQTDNGATDAYPFTLVHGVNSDFALICVLSYMNMGSESCFGDVSVIAKYRFMQNDKPGSTERLAVLGGLEVPTGDAAFSNDRVDILAGFVWTYQRIDHWIDLDLVYKMNNGAGVSGADMIRSDFAYACNLSDGEHGAGNPWAFYLVNELNSAYFTDSSSQIFYSPGLQYITKDYVIEAGVQLPVYQNLAAGRSESRATWVLSLRLQY